MKDYKYHKINQLNLRRLMTKNVKIVLFLALFGVVSSGNCATKKESDQLQAKALETMSKATEYMRSISVGEAICGGIQLTWKCLGGA